MCHFTGRGCCGGPPRGRCRSTANDDPDRRAPAGNIPQQFEVDISEMSIDNPVRVSDIALAAEWFPKLKRLTHGDRAAQ